MNRNDQEFVVRKIRAQYMEKQPGALDELRALDARVKRPANVFSYTFGTLSALIMGAGMSLVMTDLGAILSLANPMVIGTAFGVIGLGMALINYPIYKKMLSARRQKYAAQILQLSDSITGEQA